MNNLVVFLRARLDEDEALAREAPPGPWHIGNAVDPTQPCNVHTFPGARLVADGLNWLVAEHIARQNPARVLAEVEAKKTVLAAHLVTRDVVAVKPDGLHGFGCATCHQDEGSIVGDGWCITLRALASVYADHPDYRAEWRAEEDLS